MKTDVLKVAAIVFVIGMIFTGAGLKEMLIGEDELSSEELQQSALAYQQALN